MLFSISVFLWSRYDINNKVFFVVFTTLNLCINIGFQLISFSWVLVNLFINLMTLTYPLVEHNQIIWLLLLKYSDQEGLNRKEIQQNLYSFSIQLHLFA